MLNEKPQWLRKRVAVNDVNVNSIKNLLEESHINTVCQSAKCPNIFECFSKKTATFMIMGDVCTRNCGFCGIKKGLPQKLDDDEPERIANAVKKMGLKYIVITSVTRDDIEDGGSYHFSKTVEEIKKLLPFSKIECLIPDFEGNFDSLKMLLEKDITVLNHNMETVSSKYPEVRKKADYYTSLNIIKRAKKIKPDIYTKSGFMVGLGESFKEIKKLLYDLKSADCDIITVGQYLRPSPINLTVKKYYTPAEFEEIKLIAENLKFGAVECGMFVRSSYHAFNILKNIVR